MKDDEFLALHPLVRQMIRESTRDRALSLNWAPVERDAFDCLGLPNLSPQATKARRATPDLIKALAAIAVQYKPLELIVLRDEACNPVNYRDNRETRTMRKRLTELNEGLLSQQIGFGNQIVREGDRLESGRAQVQLLRIFHRADFRNGGRFYHAFWQNAPKISGFDKAGKYRRGRDQITINGGPTAEVDYRGLHVRLLYQEVGKQMPTDPYDFAPRGQAKLALVIAINARSHISAVRALADALRSDDRVTDRFKTADRLLKAAKAKHPDIAWAIASDAGSRLMRKDSELAEHIMLETLRAIGIVPLAVHDSFIVPANQEGRLMETMEAAISCGNNLPKNPCGNSPQNGDKLSPCFSGGTPGNVSTIRDGAGGRGTSRCRGDPA